MTVLKWFCFRIRKLLIYFAKEIDGVTAIEYAILLGSASLTVYLIFGNDGNLDKMHKNIWHAIVSII